MPTKKPSFEDNLANLQGIVEQLEKGDVPLEQALDQFQKGIKLSKQLEDTLKNAEETLTKVMSENGDEVPFEAPANQDGDTNG